MKKIICFLAIGIALFIFSAKAYGCSWSAVTTCDTRVSECRPGQAWNPNYWYWSSDCGILWCINHPMPFPIGICAWITGWTCNSSGVAVPTGWGYDHNFGGGCPGDAAKPACKTNGACGSSNGGIFASAPATNLCSVGANSVVSSSGVSWVWTCAGSGGGSTASCSACNSNLGKINGACNITTGTTSAPYPQNCSAPSANLCSIGAASAVSGIGPWTWTCAGSCGGESANCRADKKDPSCGDTSQHCPGLYADNCGNMICNGTMIDSAADWNTINCDKSCGGGIKTRTYSCSSKKETQACNSQPCPPGYREVAPW